MQIYESCTGEIYIAEDGYSPEACEICGDSDSYIGNFNPENIESFSEILIEELNIYNSDFIKEILKEINLKRKFTDFEKEKIKKEIEKYFKKMIEKIFEF